MLKDLAFVSATVLIKSIVCICENVLKSFAIWGVGRGDLKNADSSPPE